MVMRVFEDNIRAGFNGVTHDTLMKGMVPNCRRGHDDARLSNRLSKLFEVPFLIGDDFAPRFFERGGVEKAIAAQVFIVITNK